MRDPKIDSVTIARTVDRNGIRAKYIDYFRKSGAACSAILLFFYKIIATSNGKQLTFDLERGLLLFVQARAKGLAIGEFAALDEAAQGRR